VPGLVESVQLLTTTLYKLQVQDKVIVSFEWDGFLEAMGGEDQRNAVFANSVLTSMRAQEKSQGRVEALKKRAITTLNVLVNGNNQFVRSFQRENGLHYKSKMTTGAIDMQHVMGTMPPQQTIRHDQQVITLDHDQATLVHFLGTFDFFSIGGLDDFTVITEERQPELVPVWTNGVVTQVLKTHHVLNMATATHRPLRNEPAVPAFGGLALFRSRSLRLSFSFSFSFSLSFSLPLFPTLYHWH
jgi:hypothetical protein